MEIRYWDSQFRFSNILPDFQYCIERMKENSTSVSIDHEKIFYGNDERQFVELFGAPQGKRALPVFIHGGYWRALQAKDHRFLIPTLMGLAGSAANLEYRLLPGVSLSDVVGDALTGLRRLASDTGCQLVPIGHSAGGHLASIAARKLPDDIVNAFVVSGLLDVLPLQWSFLKDEVGLSAATLEEWNPQLIWKGGDASHLFVVVGSNETPEFHRQAHMFADSYGATTLEIGGAHHMTILNDLADPNGMICTHLKACLKLD